MEKRFHSLPFKCNLQRYNEGGRDRFGARSSAPKTGSRLIGIADESEFPSLGGMGGSGGGRWPSLGGGGGGGSGGGGGGGSGVGGLRRKLEPDLNDNVTGGALQVESS
jgi:hypothetical protein